MFYSRVIRAWGLYDFCAIGSSYKGEGAMKEVQTGVRAGNAATDTSDSALRRWLVGNFQIGAAPVPSHSVELKYGVHQAGEERTETQATSDPRLTSLAILIRGKDTYWFKDGSGMTHGVTIQEEGDYVVWDPEVLHWWAIGANDTIVLTFRWVEAVAG